MARARLRLEQYEGSAVEFRAYYKLHQIIWKRSSVLSGSSSSWPAFKANDYRRSEAGFWKALAAGSDEAVCRQHLARIYNSDRQWAKALEQWDWLRKANSAGIEPELQVARALLRRWTVSGSHH